MYKFEVFSFILHQIVVVANLYYFSVLHYNNLICQTNSAQPMSRNNDCLPWEGL